MNRVKQMIHRKSVIPLLVTVGVIALLVFSGSTAHALTISFPSVPPSGTLGDPYTFTVQVDVQGTDLLPIRRIDLQIYNAGHPGTYRVDCTDLPIPSSPNSTASKTYTGTSGTVSVSGTTSSDWGYGYGDRYGYGYGYDGWNTYPFGYGYGYGYGYGDYVGPTSISYTVTWTPPMSWPTGTYNIEVLVYGDGEGTALTHPDTIAFTLKAPPSPPSGGGPGPEPGITWVSHLVKSDGTFIAPITARSEDRKVAINIPKGTIGKTSEGRPLREINIKPMDSPPAPPSQANFIGLTYDFGPEGATFDPPITVTFTYDPTKIPADINVNDLVIAFYDEAAGQWVPLSDIVVDPVTHTISGKASHFTPFTILYVPTPPTTTPPATPTTTPPATPTTTTPTTTPPTTTPTNWGLIGGLIAGAIAMIVIGLLVYFLWWRRRY